MSDPRHILAHARGILIETIMTLIGRASSDPREFRKRLEAMDSAELRRLYRTLEDGE